MAQVNIPSLLSFRLDKARVLAHGKLELLCCNISVTLNEGFNLADRGLSYTLNFPARTYNTKTLKNIQ